MLSLPSRTARFAVPLLALTLLLSPGHVPAPEATAATPIAPTHVGKVRWGYYVPYAADSLESLKQNISSLTHLSPYWFQIDGSGALVAGETRTNATEQATVRELARKHNVRVLPMIKNSDQYEAFKPVLADPATRKAAVERIAQAMVDGNFDGAHIDFEGITAEDRPHLTQFMADLAPLLRAKGKLVTQAVAAKDRERTTGWAGAYDYAALAPHNDLIVTMTYGYGTGKPQSTAPYPWVVNSTAFAASQVGRDKLLLGLAWYGYEWNLTSGGVKALKYPEAMDRLAKSGAELQFDAESQTARFSYTANSEQFEVWFEDGRANDAKMDLVFRMGLAGAAAWRIGHEDPAAFASVRGRLGYQTWYLAEGATVKPYDTWVLIQNPNATPVTAKVTFYKEDGTTAAFSYPIPASSRHSIYANALVPDTAFSTKVEADAPVLVERAMYFGFDGHGSAGVNAPQRAWYLPDGSSRDTDTWLLLMNPSTVPATAKVTFLQEEGAPVVKEFTIKPTSRLSVFTNEHLPNTRFSMVVEAGSPIVAERASYMQGGRAGDGKPGTWFLERRWFAAEGFTGHSTNLVAMNPGTSPAQATFTLMRENGQNVTKAVTIAPQSRVTVSANELLPPNTAFSTQVESDQPIALERTAILPENPNGRGVHSSMAVTGPARTWYLAEGSTGAPFSTYILMQNPGDAATQVTLTFMTEGGRTTSQTHTVGPKARFTLLANAVVPNAAISTRIDSEHPIIVERAMYFREGATASVGIPQ